MKPPPPIDPCPEVGEVIVTLCSIRYSRVRDLHDPAPPHKRLPAGTRVRVMESHGAQLNVVTLDGKYATVLLEEEFRWVSALERLAEQAE